MFEWLAVPENLAYAVMSVVGCSIEDHVSTIAFVLPNEWETMVTGADIGGFPMNFALRAKLRQVLLSARILVGLVRAPAAPATPGPAPTTIVHNHGAEKDNGDGLTTVNIMDVPARHGADQD